MIGESINFGIAFAAGLASFLAPCTVTLLPAFLGFLGGVSAKELGNRTDQSAKLRVLQAAIAYILGFSLIFVVLGASAAAISGAFVTNQLLLQQLGGAIIIFFALVALDLIRIPSLITEQRVLPIPRQSGTLVSAFLLGMSFSLAWTPCVGPTLAAILALAATTQTVTTGAGLLLTYSLGISLPYLAAAVFVSQTPTALAWIRPRLTLISRLGGGLLLVLGTLLLTDSYKYLNGWVFTLFEQLGYQPRL